MLNSTRGRMDAEVSRQIQLTRDIARAQADVSTQLRVRRASDDPVAAARVSQIRRAQADEAAWTANIDAGAATASRLDSTLDSMQTQVDRARELMIRGRNAALSANDRQALSIELRGIAEDLAQMADTRNADGSRLFSDAEPLQLPVGPGVTVSATVSRDRAFGDLDVQILAAADALGIEDDATRDAAAAAALDRIDGAAKRLTDVRAEQGLRAARLDSMRDRYGEMKVDHVEERTNLEGTDMAETIAFIQKSLLTLEAAQTSFARVSAKTLFDVLR